MKKGLRRSQTLCMRMVPSPRLPMPCPSNTPEVRESPFEAFLEQQKPLGQISLDPIDPTVTMPQSHRFLFGICLEFCFYLFCIFVFQSGTLKDPDSSKTPPQRPPPQGCLQYILDCNGIAVGPKQVQAS